MRLSPTKKASKVNYTQSRDRVKVEGNLEVTGTSTLTGATTQTGALTCASTISKTGANGQALTLKQATLHQNIATASGAGSGTITLTGLIPAGALVLGIDGRVTTILAGGLATFSVGVSGSTDRFATGVLVAAGTTFSMLTGAKSTFYFPQIYVSATDVLLTANTSNLSTGYLRITVHYLDLTAATS